MMAFKAMAAAGLLHLASAPVSCGFMQAPVINISPVSAPVQYDFSYSAQQLSQMQSNTVSPYAPGTRTTTEGLRKDRPMIRTDVQLREQQWPDLGLLCLTYAHVNVSIQLAPTIYIAREWPPGQCRNAILEHEEKHVRVDREVTNRFSQAIGQAVQNAVNEMGAYGPVNSSEMKAASQGMIDHITAAVESQEMLMYKEMGIRQGEVDSLEEYQRVSKICRGN